jgi:hypothetical protein
MNTSLWSITVTWIPMGIQLGSQVFCAVASDRSIRMTLKIYEFLFLFGNFSVSVQSDQYCVKFNGGLTSVLLCPGETEANGTEYASQLRQLNIFILFIVDHRR